MTIFHRSNLRSEETGEELLNFDSLSHIMERAVEITREEAPEYSGADPRRAFEKGSLKQSLRGHLLQSLNRAAIVIEADQRQLYNTRTGFKGTRENIIKFVMYGTSGGQRIYPSKTVPSGLPKRGPTGKFNKQKVRDPKARLAFYLKINPLHLFIARYVTRGDTPPNRFDLRAIQRLKQEIAPLNVARLRHATDSIWARLDAIGGQRG